MNGLELKVEKSLDEKEVKELVSDKVSEEKIEESLNYEMLSAEEKKAVDEFNSKIDIEDAVVRGQDIDSSEIISDFDRIEGYKRLESDYEAIIKLGEDLANVEATSD